MGPTDTTILSSFLLPPAPLPAIITLKAFTELFPRPQQASPEIRTLYRDLQHQRARINDAVTRNIGAEVKRGIAQRRAVVRARRAAEREERDDEVDVETALFGQTSNLPVSEPHSLASILPDLERAAEDVEDEIRRMDEEAEAILEELRGTVGKFSDLRFGKLANTQLREQILEGLTRLEGSCGKR